MQFIRKIKKWYLKRVHPKDITDISRAEQEQFIAKLGEPKANYDRVYMKYRCRNYLLNNKGLSVLMNLCSVFVLPFLWVLYVIRGKKMGSGHPKAEDLLLLRIDEQYADSDDIFPPELQKDYGRIKAVKMKNFRTAYLDRQAGKVFRKSFLRHPLKPYMQLLVLCNLADMCQVIHTYNPKAVATFAEERVFAKPLVKELCDIYHVDYIGFMHGESYYQIDKGFFSYSRYYVWDDYYKKLYRDLKCDTEFRTYLPKKLQLRLDIKNQENCEYFCTYYMVGITGDDALLKIAEVFSLFADAGLKCKIRPHPRYAKEQRMLDLFPNTKVEDAREVSIRDSLNNTYFAISTCSTVLSEAHYAGKKIIIDNFSDPDQFDKISEKEYIMISKADLFLSELINRVKNGQLNFDSSEVKI